MPIAETLLPEFDREMAVTRKLLERVPDGQFEWKPHAKSMTLGRLAGHLAELAQWVSVTITQSSLDVAVPRPPGMTAPGTRAAVLALFDTHVASARAALIGRSDAELQAPWSLKRGGETMFTMPKASVLRMMVFNHIVHHRGQLSVYLRMHDVPLPSIYGPSADEAV
jgi:uncharacterized damage-inducible protein DinB